MIESQELSSFSFRCGNIDPAIALASTPGARFACITRGVNTASVGLIAKMSPSLS